MCLFLLRGEESRGVSWSSGVSEGLLVGGLKVGEAL